MLNFFVIEKGSRQVRLRIEISRDHPVPTVGEHPCHVVHQGGLADAALVVEERDHWWRHGRLLIVTATWESVTVNSGGGLLLRSSDRRVAGNPMPKRCT